jgi:hypothetical protein
LGSHFIHLAQKDPTGEMINQLQKVLETARLEFDNEPMDKIDRRRQLLRQLFKVVREEAAVINGEKGSFHPYLE